MHNSVYEYAYARATMRTRGVVAHGDTHQRARAQRVPSAFARPRVCDRATAPAQRNVDIDGANATYTPPQFGQRLTGSARACSAPQRMAGRAKMHASFGHHRSALATRCALLPCPKMKATVACCVIVCAAIGAHPFAYARVQAALECESGQPQRQTRAKRW